MEEPLTYIFQVGIIRCYFTGVFSSTKEVMVKGGDLDICMRPLKEYSTIKFFKAWPFIVGWCMY